MFPKNSIFEQPLTLEHSTFQLFFIQEFFIQENKITESFKKNNTKQTLNSLTTCNLEISKIKLSNNYHLWIRSSYVNIKPALSTITSQPHITWYCSLWTLFTLTALKQVKPIKHINTSQWMGFFDMGGYSIAPWVILRLGP